MIIGVCPDGQRKGKLSCTLFHPELSTLNKDRSFVARQIIQPQTMLYTQLNVTEQ